MANRSNRNGIPANAPDDRRANVCIWPDCDDAPTPGPPVVHLCVRHFSEVGDAYIAVNNAMFDAHVELLRGRPPMTRYTPKAVEGWRSDRVAPEPEKSPGTVYYIRCDGFFKIGWASDLASRMKQYPPTATLVAAHPGTRDDEAKLHKRFAVHRTHGREWFTQAPVIRDHVAAVVREHGEPPAVTVGARPAETPRPHSMSQRTRPRGWVGS